MSNQTVSIVYVLTFYPDTTFSAIYGIYKTIEGAHERIQRTFFRKDLLPGLEELKKAGNKTVLFKSEILQLEAWNLE